MSLLLEREQALADLQARWSACAEGRGSTVLVTGEAGIGKTSLLEHFTGSLHDGLLLWGACEPLSTPRPLGPLHDFASTLRPLRQLLEGNPDRAALFPAFLALLEASRGPVLLVIEDLHWADAATLDLVRYLGRRVQRRAVLQLLSCRDDALSWGRIRPAVAEMPPDHVLRLELQPLSPDAVRALAAPHAVSADAVHHVTGGNPFFVTELLRKGERAAAGVPATVRDAVLGRAGRLPAGARRLLELVALFPRTAETDLLEALQPSAIRHADACLAAGLLVMESGHLRFRHELARAAVESVIAPSMGAAWHRRVLEVLAARPPGSVPLAWLVHHARMAGQSQAVLHWAPQAAAEAARRGSRREAVEHYRAALRVAHGMDDGARARLLQAYAAQCFELNALAESIAAYREAIELFQRSGRIEGQVECLSALSMPLVRSLRNAEADASSRAALALAGALPPGRVVADAYATESYLRMLNRDCAEAITSGERAMAMAEAAGEREILARACKTVGSATFFIDYPAGCVLVERSLAIARGLEDGGAGVADAYVMLGTASAELFELDAAERYLHEGIAFARAHDLDRLAGYMEAWQALCDLYRGRWDAAGARATRLAASEPEGTTNRVMALLALGRLRTRRGDAGADEVLDEALALASHSGTLQRLAPVCAARAEAAWLKGDLEAMAHEAGRAFELARSKAHAWYIGELAHWLWRAGILHEAPARCARPHALQMAGRWREAAEAWDGLGCPYERARCLADGDEAAQREALALLDALGAKPLSQRLRAAMRAAGVSAVPRGPQPPSRANAVGLTRRELEVLRLLSAGLRNAQIAGQLSRSVRTVDHHVEALCRKLGCSSRSDAVAAGQRLGLLEPK